MQPDTFKTRLRKAAIKHGVRAAVTIVVYSAVCKHMGYRMVKPLEALPGHVCMQSISGAKLCVNFPEITH
jgi:hypothetical protein